MPEESSPALPTRRRFALRTTVIVLTLGVLVAGGSAVGYLYSQRHLANERAAIASLRTYCVAQNKYRRTATSFSGAHGYPTRTRQRGSLEYAECYVDLNRALDDNGDPLQLISAGLAAASGSKGTPLNGYLFADMESIADTRIDWVKQFALCAVPAEYDVTGRRTFIVKTDGVIWAKDFGKSEFVKDFPADPKAADWEKVE